MIFERLHHVGLATPDLEASIAFYRRVFGAEFHHREQLESQGVEVALASLPHGGEIELLMPIRSETGIAKFLSERGPGQHHVAFAVADLLAALAQCAAAGIELIDQTPRRGAAGLSVAFLHPRSTERVLIELVEEPVPV